MSIHRIRTRVPVLGLIAFCAPAWALHDGDDEVVPQVEEDVYALATIPLPEGCVLEVGGMDTFSDGRLAISTRRGQVWIVENPLADDVADTKVTLFHEGLWEGLGIDVVDDRVHVLQRGELSRLYDLDGDGRCDRVETVASDWGVSGHYHEFAFGLPRTDEGDWFLGLNVSFGDPEWWHGRSTVPFRGWIMKASPDGTVTPWAHGLRSPNGVALDSRGRLFVTDNQGDWVASSPIYHVVRGGFYGHPKSLRWTDAYLAAGKVAHDEIPPPEAALGREPAAIWIPYEWSRSTGNLLEDTTGKFGVPTGQFIVAELTNGMILRAGFETVQGVTQGWIVPLRQRIGSVNRVFQMPDGTLFCGLTNRGWGGLAPADGLVRVEYTGAEALEFADMKLLDAEDDDSAFGFELTFTEPLAATWTPTDANTKLELYDYDYWWEYGSPERHKRALELDSLTLSEDRTTLVVRSFELLPAMCARITLSDVIAEDGGPLLHPSIAYTINQLPSGAKTNAYVAKMVPPPPSKGDVDAGVLRLSWGDAMGQFESSGWELCDASLAGDPTRFTTSVGNGALVNTGETPSDYVTKGSFGDAHVHVEFMLPEGGASGIEIPGIGRIRLDDDPKTCGMLGANPPMASGYTEAGTWHPVDVYYRMASADAPAFLDRVELNGVVVQEGLELTGAPPERGPLRFLGTLGPVALRNIQVKPLDRPSDDGEWTFLDVGATWDDWELAGDCDFELAGDELVGKGALGFLFAPLDDLGDATLRARVKINGGGAGAVILNSRETDDGVEGVAVRVNAGFDDGVRTASVRVGEEAAPIATELIAADTWADLEVDVRRDGAGTRVRVSLNGVVVNEMTTGSPVPPGGLALRCDHDGTVFKLKDLRFRR